MRWKTHLAMLYIISLMFFFGSPANARTVLLVPAENTDCFDAGFNQTAYNISATISDSRVLGFNCTDLSSLNTTLAAEAPTMVYVVMHPANITPDFMVELEDVLKQLDDDPFLDVPYSIITANDSSTALDFFRRDVRSIKQEKMFISAYPSTCFPTSDVLAQLIPYNIYVNGSSADTASIVSNFTQNDLRAALYLCGDPITYNQIRMSDGKNVTVNANAGTIWGGTADITTDNTTLYFLTSSSARVSGSSSSPWAISLNDTASPPSSFPVVAANSVANYLGYHSTKWLGFEHWVNQFFIELSNGTSLARSLQIMKNLMVLNKEEQNLSTLMDFMESNLVLFGKDNSIGSYSQKPYYYRVTSRRQLNSTITLNQSIWFDATISVSIPSIEAIVSNDALVPSKSAIWITNISQLDSSRKTVNISFLSAVTGIIVPDVASKNIVKVSSENVSENFTLFRMEVNDTLVNITSKEFVENISAIRIGFDENGVYFARLSSPNETKNNAGFTLNLTYYTEGVVIQNESYFVQNNETTLTLVLYNPLSVTISNLTFVYPIPNASQRVSVSQNANYRVYVNSSGKFVEINISALSPGETTVSITYESTLKKESVEFDQVKYDRGDTIRFSLNLSFNYTDDVDVVTKIYDPSMQLVWMNRTTISIVNNTKIDYTALTLNSTYPAGNNKLIIEVYDNITNKPLNNYTVTFETTDRLMLIAGNENITFTHTNHSQTGDTENWYFTTDDYVNLTGTVADWTGTGVKANITITLYLPTPQTREVQTYADGGYADVQFSWSNAPVGSYVLSVFARDDNNNSVEYNKTIHITRFLNYTVVHFNITKSSSGDYIFNDEDKIYIIVEAYDENNEPVYDARVNLVSPQISSSGSVLSATTDTSGKALLIVVPESSDITYRFNISVYSPLNITEKIYNYTLTAYVKDIARWKYNSYSSTIINAQSPIPAIRDKSVKLKGNLSITSGSTAKISGGSLHYTLWAGGSDVTSLSSCSLDLDQTDLTFEITCTPKTTDRHCLRMNATLKYDGVDIKENDILYCFDVQENQTSSSQSSGSQQQSTVGMSCSKDDDCAAGEYCYKNVCTALKCNAGEVIYNHKCVVASELYSLDISSAERIVVARGSEKTFTFTLKNTGKEKQTNIKMSLESSQIKWHNWYELMNASVDELDAGENVSILIKFRADENASVDDYMFTIKLSSDQAQTQKSFVFYVAPTASDVANLNSSYEEFRDRIEQLRNTIEELLKKRNTSETRLAENKLSSAEKLLSEMENYINEGKYLEAYLKKNELAALLSDLDVLVQAETQKIKESRKRQMKYAFIAIFLGALAFGFYYLWTLPPGYRPSKGYVYKSPSSTLDKVKDAIKRFKDKLRELNKVGTRPRYNFHRRQRWRYE